MPKSIELNQDGFRTVWTNGADKGMVDVNVYQFDDKEPLIEWSYPKVVGNSIMGNATVWLPQAILQAQGELRDRMEVRATS